MLCLRPLAIRIPYVVFGCSFVISGGSFSLVPSLHRQFRFTGVRARTSSCNCSWARISILLAFISWILWTFIGLSCFSFCVPLQCTVEGDENSEYNIAAGSEYTGSEYTQGLINCRGTCELQKYLFSALILHVWNWWWGARLVDMTSVQKVNNCEKWDFWNYTSIR